MHVTFYLLTAYKFETEQYVFCTTECGLNSQMKPTDSRRRNKSGRFLLPRTNTNRYKTSFLLSALSGFNENYISH